MARADTAFPVEIGIGILVSIPFTTTIFQGGLSSIPTDIYEAARIDGASGMPAVPLPHAADAASRSSPSPWC